MATAEDSNSQASQSSPRCSEGCQEDIEEGRHAYRLGGFHPVYVGDIYHDRYEVLSKLGYGGYSTVWLVRDIRGKQNNSSEFLALKVLSAECYGAEKDLFEGEILRHLKNGDPKQVGYEQICHLVNDFEHKGPNGTHVCLVFELIGETLRSFGAWFPESMIPESVMRRFTIQLLLALDYAHDHNVIHTDIQPRNIFVKMRDYTLIESGYLAKGSVPQQDKTEDRSSIVPSRPLRHHYFNTTDNFAHFDIVLGDWGVSSWANKHLTEKIQPVALRSPEVLIEAPWDVTTDFWNLGAVLLELFCAVRMFSGAVPPDGHYELRQHLTEVVDLFGPFPTDLLEKGCQNIVQPFFDGEGRVKNAPPLNRPGLLSDAFMPGLKQEVREDFASFLFAMMKINPMERPSPEDLLRHPWLGALQ